MDAKYVVHQFMVVPVHNYQCPTAAGHAGCNSPDLWNDVVDVLLSLGFAAFCPDARHLLNFYFILFF